MTEKVSSVDHSQYSYSSYMESLVPSLIHPKFAGEDKFITGYINLRNVVSLHKDRVSKSLNQTVLEILKYLVHKKAWPYDTILGAV